MTQKDLIERRKERKNQKSIPILKSIPDAMDEEEDEQIIDETTDLKSIAQKGFHSRVEPKEAKELDLIESIDFKNGENTLSIRFSKRHNRMFRIQVFLNNKNEIRPVTYTGASTGYSFWALLKGAMNK